MSKLYEGMVFPATMTVLIDLAGSGVRPNDVMGASLWVKRPGASGDPEQWGATVIAQGDTTVTIAHGLLDGDLDRDGEFRVYGELVVPSGPIRTETITMPVYRRFG